MNNHIPYYEVNLPDGSTIEDWTVEQAYSRTYIVDQHHPSASDESPGTEDSPFASINRAAYLLKPGERVLVKNGLYREWVRPIAGGTGPDRMITYAAYPGHTPVIRTSSVIDEAWTESEYGSGVHRVELPLTFFQEWSPLMAQNLTDVNFLGMGGHFVYYYQNIRGKHPYILRRALLFADGIRLEQVAEPELLASTPNSYYVETDSVRVIHVHLADERDPNRCGMEVSSAPFCFSPDLPSLHYIRVSGFTMEHAGNGFAYPMAGAISPNFGHHWIIENNIVRQCNGIGIDVGVQLNRRHDFYYPGGGGDIVRGNVVEDCGFGGIEGSHLENTVVENNIVRRCCWHNTELYYENGGMKFLYNRNVLVRNNHVYDIRHANAIWMDWACENIRVSGNLIHDVTSIFGGLFVEASVVPNLVDNNIIWNIEGNGIYQHDCDRLIIAHNLIGACTGFGVKMWKNDDRDVLGAPPACKENEIFANVFYDTSGPIYSVTDLNRAWDNVIARDRRHTGAYVLEEQGERAPAALFPKLGEQDEASAVSPAEPPAILPKRRTRSVWSLQSTWQQRAAPYCM